MNLVQLLPVGTVESSRLEDLRLGLVRAFRVDCEIASLGLDPQPCYHPERQQHHSSEILQRMQALEWPEGAHILGVTAVDLYIPILQYVFGEAQLGGQFALVSLHRLRQEFYGLAPDEEVLRERLLKEAMHELGHTLDLRHCEDYGCAMASAHAVEYIDLRESLLCESCSRRARSRISGQQDWMRRK